MQRIIFALGLLTFISIFIPAQEIGNLNGGIRIQKSHNFYWENGLTLDYSHPKVLNSKLHVGFSYYTTKLGSAIASNNVLNQDNYLFSAAYIFRNESIIRPIAQINFGKVFVDYESRIFDVLDNSALLFSAETGVFLDFKFPVKVMLNLGYNLITSDGTSGVGTVYPLYYKCSLLYHIF
jgi:hypothetical protein